MRRHEKNATIILTNTEFHQCDILDKASLQSVFEKVRPQRVIHLAARVDLDEEVNLSGYAANIDGVKNILQCAGELPSVDRIIITSSQLVCKVGYVPKSDTDYCPNTLYGESKVLTEKLTRNTDGVGKEWCIVRPTTVWGPHMNEHYYRMMNMIYKGRYFHCGSSMLQKSYSYAGNIAYQYWKVLVAPSEEIHKKTFYFADYSPLSLREYTNSLAKELNAPRIPTLPLVCAKTLAAMGDILNKMGWKSFPFNSFRLRNILTEYQFDLSATERVCGNLPYCFEDGIKATARWFTNKENEK
ncbi:MAG TPA: NAD-dependent epimerase/dehydratase family protein [Deltaproteobacteria bacterium]|nr:NAD-dependent epimerase/dehydratase family protein [Deltaproteobacteria bacterium]